MRKDTSKRGIKLSAVTAEMAARVAARLRSEWPQHTAKHAARALNADERTVKAWLAGQIPGNSYLVAMAQRWGWQFLAWLYEPACGTPAGMARLEAEIAAERERISRLEDAWRAMARAERINLEGENRGNGPIG